MKIQYENLTIRQTEVADAKQLAAWWNDGAVMAHAGFPNGLGTTEEEVIKGLGNGRMVIEESYRLIGECNYRSGDSFTEYDDTVVRRLVECIKVSPDRTIEIILKGGIHGKEKV